MKHLSVKIAVFASLVYALLAVCLNIFTAFVYLLSPAAIAAPWYNTLTVAVAVPVSLCLFASFFSSIFVLLRHEEIRLIGFLTLVLSSVGLSLRLQAVAYSLGKLIHFN